ncbi:hypothetical protein D3Y59_10005 [Hymenobacter oligotrophus]|uniref:Uncharacterized protein n=1 Tax=Hymenobacter oligotrophus TaxID=2319843 RepID=A0A3B7R1Q6_9BACT|nr:hypothetical protein [Hymenobacter oligotrophus]AYA37353.1 hypothetical protein D3Y59_10005 [Hymenobacter oligotrophus]
MRQLYAPLLTAGLLLGLSGCFIDVDERPVLPPYRPILMSRATLEQSVALVPARTMRNTGKIYLKDKYVFINERYEGIHIIDNHDPAQPRNVGFLRIPGNVDVAMRGALLYADNAVDLVTVNLADPANARVVGRTRNAFPELAPPEPASIEPEYRPENRPADAVVVGWQKVNK